MKLRICMQRTAAFLLALVIACSFLGTSAVSAAETTEDGSSAISITTLSTSSTAVSGTLGGFIAWMLARDDLTTAQQTDLENAQSMLESYVSAGYIDLSDDDDAASLDNLKQAVKVLKTIRKLRKSDEYYNQLYDMTTLYTNFTMMVGSAYTADVSIYQIAHVSDFSSFASCEGLAWGYTNAASGWYSEVSYIEQAMDTLGYSVSSLTESQWDDVLTLAESYGVIGHYTMLFLGVSDGVNTLMGVGYTTEAYLFGSTSSVNAAYATQYSGYAKYTPAKFEDLIEEYEESILSSDDVTLSYTSCTYNGNARKPSVTVTVGDTTLKKGTDYTVTYKNNTNAGTATVTVKGIGNYSGTVKKKFTIKQKSIASDSSAAKISLSKTSCAYSGNTKKPSTTVKITLAGSRVKLTKGTDYTVKYSNNKSIGTATVTITGTGNYKGTIKTTFTIRPKQVKVSSASNTGTKKIKVKWSKVSGSVTGYQIRYRVKGTSKWTTVKVTSKSGTSTYSKTLSVKKSGKKYEIQVRAYKRISGKNYYGSWSDSVYKTSK